MIEANLKIDKRLKMKVLGVTLFAAGLAIHVYSVLYGSSNMGFWALYIGMLFVITGLGFLGLNVGGYPF